MNLITIANPGPARHPTGGVTPMRIFLITATVVDKPTTREVSAVVAVPNKREARRLARRVLVGAYNDEALGWSHAPRIEQGSLLVEEVDTSSPRTLLTRVD